MAGVSKIPRTLIAKIIAKHSLETKDASVLAKQIAGYLFYEGRLRELDSVLRDVMQYRADQGIVEVLAYCAHPLSSEARTDITQQTKRLYPQAQQVIISERIDKSLLAGVRLEYANHQLDVSARSQLNRFKQLTAVA